MKRAFTLIELLVVIAIVAILAAILFPVFAQAKEAAKKIACLSNAKQLGTATLMYANDYDDALYAHRWNCGGDATNNYSAVQVCQDYLGNQANGLNAQAPDQNGGLGSAVNMREFWVYMLYPYTKSFPLFKCPDQSNGFVPGSTTAVAYVAGEGAKAGNNYGGQNSYGHNDAWLSPAANVNGGSANLPVPPTVSSVPRVASTIEMMDSSYYGVSFDAINTSGLTNMANLAAPGDGSTEQKWQTGNGASPFYAYYWMNQGGGLSGGIAYSNGTSNQSGETPGAGSVDVLNALSTSGIQSRHSGKLNVQWVDGHAKNMDYHQTVGNVCFWSTDAEGAHPLCSG